MVFVESLLVAVDDAGNGNHGRENFPNISTSFGDRMEAAGVVFLFVEEEGGIGGIILSVGAG